MLFGRRPFGHDQTQERILREDTIIKARKVDFPSRPAVSNEAKASLLIIVVSTFLLIFNAARIYSIHLCWSKYLSLFLANVYCSNIFNIPTSLPPSLCLSLKFLNSFHVRVSALFLLSPLALLLLCLLGLFMIS